MISMLNRLLFRIVRNPNYQFMNDTEFHILKDDLDRNRKYFMEQMESSIMLYENYTVKMKEVFNDLEGVLKRFSIRYAQNTINEEEIKRFINNKVNKFFKDDGKKNLCVYEFTKKYIFFRKVLPELNLNDLILFSDNGCVVMKINKADKVFRFSLSDNQTEMSNKNQKEK